MADLVFSGVTLSGGFTITPPPTVPGAPTIGTATTTSGTTATVAFTAPAFDGGSTITSYTATSSPGSITGTLSQAGSGTITVTGLSQGTSYTFTVTATNIIGTSSASSASNSITTYAVPGAPTIGTATATGATTATVAFTQPASDGGSTITSYTATSSPGSITGTLSQAGSGTINMTGLTGGTSYTFTVTATNSVGTSSASSASNSITPVAPKWMGIEFSSGARVYGIAVDTSGNIYGALNTLGSKLNSAGVFQWQYQLVGSPGVDGTNNYYAAATDSSGNAYYSGVNVYNTTDMAVAKYNSAGSIQWQRRIGSTGQSNGVAIDSSGNVHIVGTTGAYMQVFKYDSSGALQWQYRLGNGTQNQTAAAVAVDSSSNVYAGGYSYDGARFRSLLAKWDSSGTLQWQRQLYLSTDGGEGWLGVGVDSSGNVYATGGFYITTNQLGVAKYNSSGTLQWQRTLGGPTYEKGVAIAVSSSGDVYVVGETRTTGTTSILIAKWNTSGTLQWQRVIRRSTSVTMGGYSIAIDADNMYIGGYTADPGAVAFTAKLPNDGTLTGTYTIGSVTVVYAATTLTEAASTFTTATPTLTSSATSFTSSTSTFTNTAQSYTNTVTNI